MDHEAAGSALLCFGGLALSLALVACGSKRAGPGAPTGADQGGSVAVRSVDEQITHGKQLYADHCAECHGDDGRHGDSPPLVGEKALPASPKPGQGLRESRFETALDVVQFVNTEMPPGEGGSLPSSDYVAIVAYLLQENGTHFEQILTPKSAQNIQLSR